MIVVLEGVSCVGKSELALILAHELNAKIHHFGPPPQENPYQWFREGFDAAYNASENLILDRYHLSNYAYRDMFGGGIMSFQQHLQLDEMLMQMDAWLFLMVDDPFAIEERIKTRARANDPGATLSREQIGSLQQRFFEAFDRSWIANKGSFQLTQFIEQTGEYTAQFGSLVEQSKGSPS